MKNILVGINTFTPDWLDKLKEINKPNIIIHDFNDDIDITQNIHYVLPLSNTDYNIIKRKTNIKILYPNEETQELLDNKVKFTSYMLEKFPDNIPEVYYLYDKKLKDISYPVIYKPVYSINGYGMEIYFNDDDFLQYNHNGIIQQFITDEYEYAGFMLCIDGFIANYKIIRHKFEKYNIKKVIFHQIMKQLIILIYLLY